jgi:SusD family
MKTFFLASGNTAAYTPDFKLSYSGALGADGYYSPKGGVAIPFYTATTSQELRLAAQGPTMVSTTYPNLTITKKFIPDGEDAAIGDQDLVLYRYAYLQLLYAEALCMQNKLVPAIQALNITRLRAGLTPYTNSKFADQATLLKAIILENGLETCGEGHRWFDLVRTGLYTRVGDSTDDPNSLLFPIHRDNLLNNSNLSLPPID